MSDVMLEKLSEAGGMFLFLAAELTVLFLAISYLVGILQRFLTPQRIQALLSSRKGKGYVVAALLGSITPFCSCSTIPFLKGLLRAKAGFGPMMVFLLASPLLNPIIIGLFVVTMGWQVALYYFVTAMAVSVIAGFALEKLGFARYVKDEAYHESSASSCATACGDTPANAEECAPPATSCGSAPEVNTTSCCAPAAVDVKKESCCTATSNPSDDAVVDKGDMANKDTMVDNAMADKTTAQPSFWKTVWLATWKDFKQVLPYLLLGIAIGSMIYGFIPTDLIVKYAGENKWYAIPVAAVIGIPLYIRAEAVIPLSAALVKKGMAMGSVMALIIGSAGASLTEVILLKSIFKNQMIAAFLAVILGMAILSGYMYNVIF
uniref:permease n=1 Tax=Thaumasiovibrio occultus TaxID=1891184 RepID=UPI000B3529F7|nr:permease [Thaumasiovibrio occultus]